MISFWVTAQFILFYLIILGCLLKWELNLMKGHADCVLNIESSLLGKKKLLLCEFSKVITSSILNF